MSTLTDAINRFRGRCKIAIKSGSEYDEFMIVEGHVDAQWLIDICDSYDKLAASHAELLEALSIAQATLPHIGGNSASTHSLMARINAALTRAREVSP